MNTLRRIAALVCVCMLVSCCALANEIPSETTGKESVQLPESISAIPENLKAAEAVKGGLNIPSTSDIVVIGADGSYSVTTSGLNVRVLPPFGWYVLTQDLAAQYDLYALLYNSGVLTDPTTASAEMINNGFHYLMIDPLYGTTVVMTIGTDGLSSFVTDSSALTSAEIVTLEGIVATANPTFPTSIISTGAENFVKYDTRNVDGTVIYTAYRSGMCIDFYVIPATADVDAELASFEYMLSDIAISLAY